LTITVRRVRPREWRRWRDLRLAALADSPRAFGSTHQTESTRADQVWKARTAAFASDPNRAVFVAAQGRRWVGCAGIYAAEDEPTTVISMWVAPEARRQGIARRLLDAVRAWAEARGEPQIRLLVVRDQRAARALYERYGFRKSGHWEPMDRDASILEDEMVLSLGGG
jgi:ribosomal protein S18 acetylase RimI-like enzyme